MATHSNRFIVARFKISASVANRERLNAIEDELDTLRKLQGDIEGFVFKEEEATELMHEVRELVQKYPDLKGLAQEVHSGLSAFHNRVLTDLSSALDELDEALSRRMDEVDELTELAAR
jgi:archaellum component FlaC